MTSLVGDCIECGFPILLQSTDRPVSCPMCATVNQPVAPNISAAFDSRLLIPIGIGAVIGGAAFRKNRFLGAVIGGVAGRAIGGALIR